MLASLLIANFALGIPIQTSDPVTIGPLTVGKQSVTLEVTQGPGTGSGNAIVEWGGQKFVVSDAGFVGQPIVADGGWKDAADNYARLAPAISVAPPLRIKVLVFSKNAIIERTADGVVRYRRSGIEQNHLDDLHQGLGQAKVLMEVAGRGALRVEYDIQVDPDLTIDTFSSTDVATWKEGPIEIDLASEPVGSRPFGYDFIRESVGPRVNRDFFEADDRVYRGPYASVLAFHGGLITGTATVRVDGTPVTALPYHLLDEGRAGDVTGLIATQVIRHHLAMRIAPSLSREPAISPIQPPSLLSAAIPADWVAAGTKPNEPQRAGEFEAWSKLPAVSVVSPNRPATAWQAQVEGRTVLVVRMGFQALPRPGLPSAAIARAGTSSDPLFVYDVPSGKSTLELLAIPLPALSRVGDGVSVSADGRLPLSLGTTGEAEVESIEDPTHGQGAKVTQQGLFYRGEAILVAGRGETPAVRATAGQMIDFYVRSSDLDRTALNLYGKDKSLIGSILLHGDMWLPVESAGNPPLVLDRRVPFDGEWHRIQVDLEPITKGASVWDIRLGRPPFGDRYQRPAPARQSVEIAALRVVPAGEKAALPPVAPTTLETFLSTARTWSGAISNEAARAIMAALGTPDPDLQANACEFLTLNKLPEAVPVLIELSRSGSTLIAYSATRALAFQDAPEGWAALEAMMIRGPFDFNRRFAAAVGKGRTNPEYINGLRGMTAASGWRGRLMGVQGQDPTMPQMAMMLMIASIQDEEPAVRLAASRLFNPNYEPIARRMIFSAVNDGSQWVRITNYLRLIDSQIPNIQSEGLKGVRDDAIGVRMALIRYMTQHPKAAYRPALGYAVIDTVPMVRAAALDALAQQEGPVVVAEFQNTLADTDVGVQRSLLRLAKAKSIALPRDVLTRLSSSEDAEVSRLAKELIG